MYSLIALAVLASPSAPAPEKFIVSCERFGYFGTISVFNSYSDAKSGKNARYSGIAMPPRDGSIYMARAMGGEYGEFNAILTNWYSTTDTDPSHVGYGNPNNKNEGFFQMYDNNADNWQNQKASWSKDKKTFTLVSKGKNASYPSVEEPGEYARLWNAGAPQGSGESTKGTYLDYEVTFVATGITGTDADNDGFFEYEGNGGSFSGTFKAIFRNESTKYPASNGWYVVDLKFNNVNWAAGLGLAKPSHFGSAN